MRIRLLWLSPREGDSPRVSEIVPNRRVPVPGHNEDPAGRKKPVPKEVVIVTGQEVIGSDGAEPKMPADSDVQAAAREHREAPSGSP